MTLALSLFGVIRMIPKHQHRRRGTLYAPAANHMYPYTLLAGFAWIFIPHRQVIRPASVMLCLLAGYR